MASTVGSEQMADIVQGSSCLVLTSKQATTLRRALVEGDYDVLLGFGIDKRQAKSLSSLVRRGIGADEVARSPEAAPLRRIHRSG